jgi:hypothetical protein
MKKAGLLGALLAMALLGGCAESGTKTADPKEQKMETKTGSPEAEKEAEVKTESGRVALQRMLAAARGWAPDAQPIRLESQSAKDVDGKDGKLPIWTGWFAAPSRNSMKRFTWSGVEGPDFPDKGVSGLPEDSWNARNATMAPFDVNFLKIDTDKAVEAANKKGGQKALSGKAADAMKVNYVLDWNRTNSKLVWHVLYGESAGQPKLKIAVDATSGEFLRTEK